jgi:hypothetical protein
MSAQTVPNPVTVNAGQPVTAAMLNGILTAGTFLMNRPMWSAKCTTAPALGANAGLTVPWDTIDIDTDGVVNPGSGEITIQTPGYYNLTWSAGTAGSTSAATQAEAFLRCATTANNPVNPSLNFVVFQFASHAVAAQAGNNIMNGGGVCPYYLFTGDTLDLRLWGDASTATVLSGSAQPSVFQGMWVSR